MRFSSSHCRYAAGQPGERRFQQRQHAEPVPAEQPRGHRAFVPEDHAAGWRQHAANEGRDDVGEPAGRDLAAGPEIHAAGATTHQPAIDHVGRAALQRYLQLRGADVRMRLHQEREHPPSQQPPTCWCR